MSAQTSKAAKGGELEIYEAQEDIRALNTELSMHDDAQAQVAALRKKINSTKERARGLVNMIDRRITYLNEVWKQSIAKREDNENIKIARGAVSDPIRIGLSNDKEEAFYERVNLLKDKVAELILLDEQAAEAHRRAVADRKTLKLAATRLKEVENRQRLMLANNDNCFSEGIDPVLSLRHAIDAIDARLSSSDATVEEKKDLEKLAKVLRVFLTGLPDHGSHSLITTVSSDTPTELRVKFDDLAAIGTGESSSGISGTTISTNETSKSVFTTSSFPSTSSSTQHVLLNPKGKEENRSRDASVTSSTTAI